MRIGIIGIGALGCLFAARLSTVVKVVVVGHWPEQLAALKHGLIVQELDGTQTTAQVMATDQPHHAGVVDIVLVLVKSYQTEKVFGRIAPLLHTNTHIITLQNGIGNLTILAQAFTDHQVTIGITSQAANIVRPGTIRHAGNGATILTTTPAIDIQMTALAEIMQKVGLETAITADANTVVWSKLAINAAINPLTAILRVPNGYLATHPDARLIMQAIANEVAAVADAQSIALDYPYAKTASEAATHVALATATNRSSMLQDIDRGTRTEIDAICGAVVQTADQVGVAAPINRQLWALVHSAENHTPSDQWNVTIGDRTIDLRTIAPL